MSMPTRMQIQPILLRVLLELGGSAKPSEVEPIITSAFPELTDEDLAKKNKGGNSTWIKQSALGATGPRRSSIHQQRRARRLGADRT